MTRDWAVFVSIATVVILLAAAGIVGGRQGLFGLSGGDGRTPQAINFAAESAENVQPASAAASSTDETVAQISPPQQGRADGQDADGEYDDGEYDDDDDDEYDDEDD